MGTFTVNDKLKKLEQLFQDSNFKFSPLKLVIPEEFYEVIGEAKSRISMEHLLINILLKNILKCDFCF